MFTLIVLILYFSFLVALPIGYFLFAKAIGRRIDAVLLKPGISTPITITLISLPFIWIGMTALIFQQTYSSASPPLVKEKIEFQNGFLITGDPLSKLAPQKYINLPMPLLASNGIQFYEKETKFNFKKMFTHTYMLNNREDFKTIEHMQSKYAFVTEIKQIHKMFPVYKIQHKVQRISDNHTIAQANDTVLGGGIIGLYLRGFGGGQDSEYISYGYASNSLGHWRPNDVSNPRRAQYLAADVAFLLSSLGRAPQGKPEGTAFDMRQK